MSSAGFPRRSGRPAPWAGETTIRTDADGRFRIGFSSEQTAEKRLAIVIKVRHLEFAPRVSRQFLVADLVRWRVLADL